MAKYIARFHSRPNRGLGQLLAKPSLANSGQTTNIIGSSSSRPSRVYGSCLPF